MPEFIICLKGRTVIAGILVEQSTNNVGTFTVQLKEAVDLTGNPDFPDITYLAIHGPTGVSLEDSLPQILLSEFETILTCRKKASEEFARALGL